MSGPGATCRRVGSSGKRAISRHGRSSGSSVGVGACSVGGNSLSGERAGPRAATTAARSRSSVGRSASSCGSGAAGPAYDAASGRRRRTTVREPATSTTTSASPGSASRSVSSTSASSRRTRSVGGRVAQGQHHRGVEPGRRAARSSAKGSRSNGTCPPRRASSSASVGTAATASPWRRPATSAPRRSSSATRGSSVTASTAANPTPKRPDGVVVAVVALGRRAQRRQRLDAGRVERRAGVRADSTPSRRRSSSRPGTPARTAASAAFCGQLDDHAVAVAAECEVLLGVGVLAEPGRRGGPGGEHAVAHRAGPERVGASPSGVAQVLGGDRVVAEPASVDRAGRVPRVARRAGRSRSRPRPGGASPARRHDRDLRVRAAAVVERHHPAVARASTRWRRRRTPAAATRPAASGTRRSRRVPAPPARWVRSVRGRRSTTGRRRRRARSARAPGRGRGRAPSTAISSASSSASRCSPAPAAGRPRASAAGRRRRGRPGLSRSLHGTHAGASRASEPGSSTTSATVTVLLRDTRVTVTAQRQPR